MKNVNWFKNRPLSLNEFYFLLEMLFAHFKFVYRKRFNLGEKTEWIIWNYLFYFPLTGVITATIKSTVCLNF